MYCMLAVEIITVRENDKHDQESKQAFNRLKREEKWKNWPAVKRIF